MADEPNKKEVPSEVESEISDLIAEAMALSNELLKEVGEEGVRLTPRDPEFFESCTDSEASMDVQVMQAEMALDETAAEVGSEPAPKPAAKKTISLPAKKAPGEADAKSEAPPKTEGPPSRKKLTLPPKGANVPTTSTATPAPKPARRPSSIEDDFMDDLVSGNIDEIPFDLEEKGPTISERVRSLLALIPSERVRSAIPSKKIRTVMRRTGELVCAGLELADRPFGRLGYRSRLALGWASLVMIVAAIALLFGAVL